MSKQRPTNEEFFLWVKNDNNLSKIRNALKLHPNLVNIKDGVSFLILFC